MPRAESEDVTPGGDSFLDIIANMVGILIILVMVVGVRAGKGALAPSPPAVETVSAEDLEGRVAELRRQSLLQREEIVQTAARAQNAYQETSLVDRQRHEMEVLRAQAEGELAERREQLDAARQREFDVQREINEAQIELSRLTQQQLQLVSQPLDVEEIESTPTPIASTVKEEAIYVRIKHGNISVVPVVELRSLVFGGESRDYLVGALRQRHEAADLFGPVDGFRLRFRVERYAEAVPGTVGPGMARVSNVMSAELLPEADDVGQPMEQALLPGSPLMRALSRRPANTTPVLAWVYPDSYDELRSLKKALWERDIALAVWPVDQNQPIVMSTNGSRAEAQ